MSSLVEAIRIAVHGAAGRMGKRVIAVASEDPQVEVVAAIEYAGHPSLGRDCGEIAGVGATQIRLTSELEIEVDALIDFSLPVGAARAAELCRERKIPLVMATTGLNDGTQELLRLAAQSIPIVWAPSMSLAVNLAWRLCQLAGGTLRNVASGVDVEIIETHHRYKADAPSGTALKFGEVISLAMGPKNAVHGREGTPGARSGDEIGYHAVRAGDNPGEHRILFGMLGESLEVTVRASSRDCYAAGALAAACFVARQPPGLYDMSDVIWGGQSIDI